MPVLDRLLLLVIAVGRLKYENIAPLEELCKLVSRPRVAGYAYLSSLARRPNYLAGPDPPVLVGYVVPMLELAVKFTLWYSESLCLFDVKLAGPVKLFKAVCEGWDGMQGLAACNLVLVFLD